jgi:hypothetical protein
VIEVGDLVCSKDGWEGWLFVVAEIQTHTGMGGYDPLRVRCIIIKAPQNDKGYPVGYVLRWLPSHSFEKINKKI